MCLPIIHKLRHTLALRLTVWFGLIFTLFSLLAMVLAYLLVVTIINAGVNEDLEEDVEEFAFYMQQGGLDRVEAEMLSETVGAEAEQDYIRLWNSNGELIASSDLTHWPGLQSLPSDRLKMLPGDDPVVSVIELEQRDDDIRRVAGSIGKDLIIEIGESQEEAEEFIEALLQGFVIILISVILLGGPIGWYMARRALHGVEEVTKTANEIIHGGLDQRVTVRSGDDELNRLAQTFNAMLDRIQALIIGMREMTDNLAHDLRSPLGRIRAETELTLTNASGTDWSTMAVRITEECDQLLEMINTTLDIAEAESGAVSLRLEEIDLAEIAAAACELFQPVAEDKDITINSRLPQCCLVRGDRQRLQRVVSNLLDNALKYTAAGGRVNVSLDIEADQARLTFEDSGVGISADEQSRIFQRFYRCDRSRSEPGNGLGLSLALALARAHGGNIEVRSMPDRGSVFTLVLKTAHVGKSN